MEWKVPTHKSPSAVAARRARRSSHLARRLVGEGDGDDLVRPRAPRPEQVCDPVSEDPGLSAARAGEDEQRPVTVLDGASLLGVQPVVHHARSPSPGSSLIDFATPGKAQKRRGLRVTSQPSSFAGNRCAVQTAMRRSSSTLACRCRCPSAVQPSALAPFLEPSSQIVGVELQRVTDVLAREYPGVVRGEQPLLGLGKKLAAPRFTSERELLIAVDGVLEHREHQALLTSRRRASAAEVREELRRK